MIGNTLNRAHIQTSRSAAGARLQLFAGQDNHLSQMFSRFLQRSRQSDDIATALYGAIVAQARNPALYADRAVPDTVEGRFEMVVLHMALVLRHLRTDEAEKAIGQRIFDLFCGDMDHSLREMGVGDLSVGKRMREMAEAFYGRAGVYDTGLTGGDPAAIVATMARAVYNGAADGQPAALAAYAMAADRGLVDLPKGALLACRLSWPDPAAAVAGALT